MNNKDILTFHVFSITANMKAQAPEIQGSAKNRFLTGTAKLLTAAVMILDHTQKPQKAASEK